VFSESTGKSRFFLEIPLICRWEQIIEPLSQPRRRDIAEWAFLGKERRCNSMNRKLVLELSFHFLTLISFIALDCGARRVLVGRSIVQGQKF
jgi:hypothetical protein